MKKFQRPVVSPRGSKLRGEEKRDNKARVFVGGGPQRLIALPKQEGGERKPTNYQTRKVINIQKDQKGWGGSKGGGIGRSEKRRGTFQRMTRERRGKKSQHAEKPGGSNLVRGRQNRVQKPCRVGEPRCFGEVGKMIVPT